MYLIVVFSIPQMLEIYLQMLKVFIYSRETDVKYSSYFLSPNEGQF